MCQVCEVAASELGAGAALCFAALHASDRTCGGPLPSDGVLIKRTGAVRSSATTSQSCGPN